MSSLWSTIRRVGRWLASIPSSWSGDQAVDRAIQSQNDHRRPGQGKQWT